MHECDKEQLIEPRLDHSPATTNETAHRVPLQGGTSEAAAETPVNRKKYADQQPLESTLNSVNRTFCTSKKELNHLDVTTNQSCQEIPSQTFQGTEIYGNNCKVNSDKSMWNNDVQLPETPAIPHALNVGRKYTTSPHMEQDNHTTSSRQT